MNQVPWKYVFVLGAIFVVFVEVFHAVSVRRDVARCVEYSRLRADGVVEFSGLEKVLSGGRRGVISLRTRQGIVRLDLGLDPVIQSAIKVGDTIRLLGDETVILAGGEKYVLFRCNQ